MSKSKANTKDDKLSDLLSRFALEHMDTSHIKQIADGVGVSARSNQNHPTSRNQLIEKIIAKTSHGFHKSVDWCSCRGSEEFCSHLKNSVIDTA